MKAAHPQESVELWCEDEARLGLQPILRRVWAPKGHRPRAVIAPEYEWLWMYAAAHPLTGQTFWLSLPRLDAEMAQLFLDEFARTHAPEGKQVILAWDGAPAHRAQSLRLPPRVRLLSVPPYSPELNPAENLWPLLREGAANRAFKDLDELEEVVCARSQKLAQAPELISSKLNYHWWPSG